MRVVVMHTDFRLYWPARLQALDTSLTERGDSMTVIEIAGHGSPYFFAHKESVLTRDWRILFPNSKPEDLTGKAIWPRLKKALDAIKPDVILAGAIAFPSGALAVRWALSNNAKVVIFDDAKAADVKRSGLVDFIKQSIYNGVDAMIYPAVEWMKTGKRWGFSQKQLFFGLDVVDNKYWQRAALNQSTNEYGEYFLCVGRQIEVKNYISLLEAYLQYANHYGNNAFNLLMIGEGPMRPDIESFIGFHNLNHKVFLLPFQSQASLAGYYALAQALCLPSTKETWGLVINEAMACGCPILASKECGASNILVEDGITGFTFHANDINQIFNSLIKIHKLTPVEKENMHRAIKLKISEWDLSKFVTAATETLEYVETTKRKKVSILNKLLIKTWSGRYRPI